MEDEQEQIKINNYDINMLVGIYFYDQGVIQLSKLAERLATPEDQVAKVLEDYRKSPVYNDFYAEMSAYANQQLGKQDSEVLAQCIGEAAGFMKAYYVMEERRVSPATIVNEGNADKLLRSSYFSDRIGEDFHQLLEEKKEGPLPGWKRLMAETAVARDNLLAQEALQAYAEHRRKDGEGVAAAQEADFRLRVSEAFQKVSEKREAYARVFDKPFMLPETAELRRLYEAGDGQKLADRIRSRRTDTLVIGEFAEFLYGEGRLQAADAPGKTVGEDLLRELTQTAWFERMVGHDLQGVYPGMMTRAQYGLAKDYSGMLARSTGGPVTVERLSVNGRLVPVVVDPAVVAARQEALALQVDDLLRLSAAESAFVRGEGYGADPLFFGSKLFLERYGEDLALFTGPVENVDVMVMEQYLQDITQQTAELAEKLSHDPSEEKLEDFRLYEKQEERKAQVIGRMEHWYTGREAHVEELSQDRSQDKAIMLLYDEKTGKFLAADAGSRLDETGGYSVIDRYTTAKHALDFIRLADQKVEQAKSGALTADSMRNEYKVYRALPADKKGQFLSIEILPAEMATKSEHPDVSAMRRWAFEYEQMVAFDLANPGVADVVKTDANRAEYQQKVDKDSGADKARSGGMARSV